MYSYEDIFSEKRRVLFVTAHPDDLDVFYGGLVARLVEDGKVVRVVVVTGGARGSRENEISEEELQAIRLDEQRQALKELGVKPENFESLCYLDGEVENNLETIGKIARVIRQFKPEIVCTHDPLGLYFKFRKGEAYYVNHRDHRLTGLSTVDAVYPFSRDRSFFREHLVENIEPHTVVEVFLTGEGEANSKIDYTGVVEKKRSALMSHKSQFSTESVDGIIEGDKVGSGYAEDGFYLKLGW